MMEKTEHASSAFAISKAAKKHPDVIRLRCKMIDLKGMRRIFEFRVKVRQKTLNNPDEVAISTLVRNSDGNRRELNPLSLGENLDRGLGKG